MAEKKTPHHDLEKVKRAFSDGSGTTTGSAIRDASALGYGSADRARVIQTIAKGHFYKSMTANHDHRIWQDVYHVPDAGRTLYVKFTDNGTPAFTLLSFKEK
jgi:motility quorum-sensing regulator/GCU-specific mRNA interferase toxin